MATLTKFKADGLGCPPSIDHDLFAHLLEQCCNDNRSANTGGSTVESSVESGAQIDGEHHSSIDVNGLPPANPSLDSGDIKLDAEQSVGGNSDADHRSSASLHGGHPTVLAGQGGSDNDVDGSLGNVVDANIAGGQGGGRSGGEIGMGINGHANINENGGEENGQGDVSVDGHPTVNSNVGEVKLGAGVDVDGNGDTGHRSDGPLVSIGDGQRGGHGGEDIGMDINEHGSNGAETGQGNNVDIGVNSDRNANSLLRLGRIGLGAGLDMGGHGSGGSLVNAGDVEIGSSVDGRPAVSSNGVKLGADAHGSPGDGVDIGVNNDGQNGGRIGDGGIDIGVDGRPAVSSNGVELGADADGPLIDVGDVNADGQRGGQNGVDVGMDINGDGNGGVHIGHGDKVGINTHHTANSNSGDVKLAADINGSPVNADEQRGGGVEVDVHAQNNGGGGPAVADVLHDDENCNCKD